MEHHCEGGGGRLEVPVWTKKGMDDVKLWPFLFSIPKKLAGNLTCDPLPRPRWEITSSNDVTNEGGGGGGSTYYNQPKSGRDSGSDSGRDRGSDSNSGGDGGHGSGGGGGGGGGDDMGDDKGHDNLGNDNTGVNCRQWRH